MLERSLYICLLFEAGRWLFDSVAHKCVGGLRLVRSSMLGGRVDCYASGCWLGGLCVDDGWWLNWLWNGLANLRDDAVHIPLAGLW